MKRPEYFVHNNPTVTKELQFILDSDNEPEEIANTLLQLCYWGSLPLGFEFWEKQYNSIIKGNDLDSEAYMILTELLRMESEDGSYQQT